MWVGIVTIFPEMFQAVSDYGITRRAIESGLIRLQYWNPRDFTTDRHRTVDDRPYGGGPGMLMMAEPLRDAICAARESAARESMVRDAAMTEPPRTIYLSPQGRPVDQRALEELASRDSMILVAGRYEGIDERLIGAEIDEEWSIGDYVLSGGELAAMVLIDGVVRLLPGALGDPGSAEEDSFANGLLDYPQYTRPEELDGRRVPEILLSGDHERIREWRLKQSLGRTWQRRPDLLERLSLGARERQLLDEFIQEAESGRRDGDEQESLDRTD